jgi:hypothetical protein
LAAVGSNYLATDYGSQIYGLEKCTSGIPHANIDIYSTDKSPLGLEWSKRSSRASIGFNSIKPKVTVPNVYSLRRSNLLK